MDLILQFVNFVVGSLAEIYKNRAIKDAQYAALHASAEQQLLQNAAAQAQAEEQVVNGFDSAMADAVKQNEKKAAYIAIGIVLLAITIVFLMRYFGKKKEK